MPPQRYEIYHECIPFRASEDARWWIVVSDVCPGEAQDPFALRVTLVPLSAAFHLFDPALHFPIRSSLPDFQATGLTRDSYVCGDYSVWFPISGLLNKTGELTGDLLDDFKEWAGD